MTAALPYFTAADIERLLPLDRAMDAIEAALRAEPGIDPESDGPRLFAPAPRGEFLLMPAQGVEYSGIKALTVAPENPDRGLEKIQGLYLLYSSDSLAPVAVMEGASLTAIRTPAITISALRQVAAAAPRGCETPASPRILVFGAGVQAASHIRAAALAFPSARFEVAGRRPERVASLITVMAEAHETADSTVTAVPEGGVDVAVAAADVIICVSSTTAPLFDGSLVKPNTIIGAAGTHGLDKREVDDALVARADLVVEGWGSAQRENGNLVSLSDDVWSSSDRPTNLRELARGEFVRTPGRPAFYSGVGMSWEDLVCATAVFTEGEKASASHSERP